MSEVNKTESSVDAGGDPIRLLITELEKSHREELQRIQLQYLEKVRQVESGRLQAEKELEDLEDRFSELNEQYRAEVSRLNDEVTCASEELLEQQKALSELGNQLIRVESLRENLDQERRGLLERLRAEEQRGVQERKRLEEDKKSFSEQLERLTAELSTSTEKRQQLEVVRAELEQRVAALESLRENLDQERRGLLERLRAEEQRGVQERKRLVEERDFYRQAMITAEQNLDVLRQGLLHQLQLRLDRGWKGAVGLPAVIWSALRSAASKKNRDAEAWLNQIEGVYTGRGTKAAEDFIRRNARDPIALATGLTRLARLNEPSDSDAALFLAKEAAKADPRPFRRKWLAFMHFDAGHLEAAYELLVSLPDGTEFSPSEKKKTELITSRYRELHADSSAVSDSALASLDSPATAVPDLSPLPFDTGKTALTDEEKQLLDRKLQAAIAQSVEALRTFLDAQCNGHTKAFHSFCHLRAAQIALNVGEDAEALRIADAVLREDGTVTTLRATARVYYNAAQLDRAETLANQLNEKLGQKIKPNDRKFIDEVLGRAQLATWATLPAQPRSIPVQPQRVLNILAFSLPYTSVGYATRSHGLAIGIKNAGWDIRPYTRPGFPYDFKPELAGQPLPEEDEIDGIVYRRIFDFNRKEMTEVEYMHAAIEHYERIIRQEEPAVVHAASNYVTALPALIAARRLGVPFIYEVRGFWEVTRSSRDEKFENTAKYRFMQLFEALTARHADHVITITSAMKEELMTRGVPEECISIAYNSVDPERFVPQPRSQILAAQLGIPENVPVIGYVGSFVDYEGLDDLVTACVGLKADGHDFRLLLVGDGAVFEDLKRQVEESGLADKTIMTGRVPHEMVEEYYSLVDIAPFPRKPWEVCELVSPLKPYEAMALEKVVVVSSTRALKEIVTHEQNGLVFAKGDVGDLQGKLAKLFADPVRGIELGKAARAWISHQRSWDVAGCSCVKVYACAERLAV